MTSSPSARRAYLRPERVDGSRCGRSEKRRLWPWRVTASANGGSGSASSRGLGHLEHARIEAQHAHDALAVVELEQRLHRVAVAGGRRDVDHAAHVAGAQVREERHRRLGRAGHHVEHAVALAQARGRQVLHLALALDPALRA